MKPAILRCLFLYLVDVQSNKWNCIDLKDPNNINIFTIIEIVEMSAYFFFCLLWLGQWLEGHVGEATWLLGRLHCITLLGWNFLEVGCTFQFLIEGFREEHNAIHEKLRNTGPKMCGAVSIDLYSWTLPGMLQQHWAFLWLHHSLVQEFLSPRTIHSFCSLVVYFSKFNSVTKENSLIVKKNQNIQVLFENIYRVVHFIKFNFVFVIFIFLKLFKISLFFFFLVYFISLHFFFF